jgi:Xaa-Pro aminopeptidase
VHALTRLANLRQQLHRRKLDALLVTCRENIRYLCGFTGTSGMLLVNTQKLFLLTDSRYALQAGIEAKDAQLRLAGNPFDQLPELLEELKSARLGFEPEHIYYDSYHKLNDICRQHNIEIIPSRQFVAELRQTKDIGEIEQIKQAVAIAENAFCKTLKLLTSGLSEREFALELEVALKRLGSARLPFEIIVASGERSAMPHGIASDKSILPGELLVIDFGASFKDYNSDITRTLLLGEPSQRQQEIYNVVYEAQNRAIAGIRPGISAYEIDKIAREVIDKAGYGEYFGHGTGHGVGLMVHEQPVINRESKSQLAPGMVFTIEPGIYLPGIGGVRIEDMVLVTDTGCDVLTSLPKELSYNG